MAQLVSYKTVQATSFKATSFLTDGRRDKHRTPNVYFCRPCTYFKKGEILKKKNETFYKAIGQAKFIDFLIQ